jgi:MFS family permease
MAKNASVVKQPGFLSLWIGQSVSVVGSQITGLVFPVLAVTYLNANEFQMGLLNAADTSAFLVFGLLAGALVDRWIKRQVMLVADLIRMLAVAVIPLLWMLGVLDVYHLMIVGAVISVATVFFDVSYQSYIPILLPKEYIGIGNARLEISGQISGIAGPGIVGALLTFLKAPVLLVIDSVSFLVSAVSLWFIKDREQEKPKTDRKPIVHEIGEGLKFVWNQKLIRAISFTTSTSNMFGTVVATMFALYLLKPEFLNLGTAGFGILMSIGSLGGLLGATATPKLIRLIGEGPLIVLSVLVSEFVQFLIPLAWYIPHQYSIILLAANSFFTSFLALTYNITQVTARQRLCPEHLLGRMNASIRFMVWGSIPIGALIAGILGTVFGVLSTIWIGVILGLFSSCFVLFSPLRTMRKMPDKPKEY